MDSVMTCLMYGWRLYQLCMEKFESLTHLALHMTKQKQSGPVTACSMFAGPNKTLLICSGHFSCPVQVFSPPPQFHRTFSWHSYVPNSQRMGPRYKAITRWSTHPAEGPSHLVLLGGCHWCPHTSLCSDRLNTSVRLPLQNLPAIIEYLFTLARIRTLSIFCFHLSVTFLQIELKTHWHVKSDSPARKGQTKT